MILRMREVIVFQLHGENTNFNNITYSCILDIAVGLYYKGENLVQEHTTHSRTDDLLAMYGAGGVCNKNLCACREGRKLRGGMARVCV